VQKQMKNIFHARSNINNKVCSIYIDSESCANVITATLVKKLNLNTIKHERHYRLQLLNEYGEVKVTK
jgi:hypothetical protein